MPHFSFLLFIFKTRALRRPCQTRPPCWGSSAGRASSAGSFGSSWLSRTRSQARTGRYGREVGLDRRLVLLQAVAEVQHLVLPLDVYQQLSLRVEVCPRAKRCVIVVSKHVERTEAYGELGLLEDHLEQPDHALDVISSGEQLNQFFHLFGQNTLLFILEAALPDEDDLEESDSIALKLGRARARKIVEIWLVKVRVGLLCEDFVDIRHAVDGEVTFIRDIVLHCIHLAIGKHAVALLEDLQIGLRDDKMNEAKNEFAGVGCVEQAVHVELSFQTEIYGHVEKGLVAIGAIVAIGERRQDLLEHIFLRTLRAFDVLHELDLVLQELRLLVILEHLLYENGEALAVLDPINDLLVGADIEHALHHMKDAIGGSTLQNL
ncbi:hypothetical protein SS50377_20408 [Spironucleus salmonicida]|uniref:Uncharacterized protein n=1 Tax=Spironucleus salmonicida TaxID=348837 RepID=V6LUA7_9EUKA|nr:hypothetical protein SS50377_20408 [Spironucleus salmonicida]|eukprot:EST48202.1 Hypothetical protein SS50377_11641 [Spironucleus salmonicida]